MKKININAFTLVELIVVITIIAILGTIAFISLQGYSITARDSTRISDLSAMKTSLELFQLDAGKYPETTSGFIVTYSGTEVWTQGIFGETTKGNVQKLDKIPKDPLTEKEYTYSLTKTKQEYELGGIIEGDLAYVPSSATFLNQTNASEIIATAIVTGNYNGQTLKTETGVICEILSIPSIISSETETTDLKTILNNKSLVYNGFNNLPSNYERSKYKTDEGFEFISEKLVVYSDNQECKPLYDAENASARINLVKNLQTAYSGTLIQNAENIKGLIALDVNDIEAVNLLSTTIINNNLGGKLATSNDFVNNNCEGGSIQGISYSGILYTYSEINNGETIIGIGTQIISNGIKNYSGNIICNNGEATIENEVNLGVSCNNGFIISGESCLAIINGECGSDNGQNLSATPKNRCNIGTYSNFVDNGVGSTYTWKCNGTNGGTSPNCSANHVPDPWNDRIKYFRMPTWGVRPSDIIIYKPSNLTSSDGWTYGSSDPLKQWGCINITISGADSMQDGKQNTTDILAGCSTTDIAARFCHNLTLGGKSDWYLPSQYEISTLLNSSDKTILNLSGRYWSSSEDNPRDAWRAMTGGSGNYYKDTSYAVRCVRLAD